MDLEQINLDISEKGDKYKAITLDNSKELIDVPFGLSENVNKEKTFTIEQAVEHGGFGKFQLVIIFICGILTSADAMEMMLLSVLGPALRCEWHLKSNEVAIITTAVFIGFLFGAPFWGFVSDKFGRLPCFAIVIAIIGYFGLLTAITPTYTWLVFLRSIIGFAISGTSSSTALMSEYLPYARRAQVLIGYQIFWAIGSSFEILLAFLILPSLGWRWLIFASAVPIILSLFCLKYLPESVRFLAASGEVEEANRIIQKMHKMNGVPPLPGRLEYSGGSVNEDGQSDVRMHVEQRGSLASLFKDKYRLTSMLMPIIWFAAAFCYYGIVLLSSEIFRSRPKCYQTASPMPDFHGNRHDNGSVPLLRNPYGDRDTSCCASVTKDDYIAMLVSSLGEFAVIPLNVLAVDHMGRKTSIGLSSLLEFFCFSLLYICLPKSITTGLMFVLRAMAAGLFNTCYTYTLEVYPTTVRSLAVGVFSSIARIGAMTTPYVAQVMLPDVSVLGAFSCYAAVSLIAGVVAFILPIETKGRGLPESADEIKVHYNTENDELR